MIGRLLDKLHPRRRRDRRFIAEKAVAAITARTVTTGVASRHRLDRDGDWRVDLDEGTLTWSFDDGETLAARASLIGSYSAKSTSFLWAWGNPDNADAPMEAALSARSYGQTSGFEALTTGAKQTCDLDTARALAGFALIHGKLHGIKEITMGPGLTGVVGYVLPIPPGQSDPTRKVGA
jgi:hypothetical protein